MMRVIVAGSRWITQDEIVLRALEKSQFTIDEIVHGGARGPDSVAGQWAEDNDIPQVIYEPDWDEYGKAAGPLRNEQMALYADALVAVWDGESSGTHDMLKRARKHGLTIALYKFEFHLVN
jgi:hypothetical protein